MALRIVGSGCSSSPTPRAKICGNHPGATDSLTGAVKMLWKTPHGFANTDAGGKTAGAAGEMVKQAVLWQTPNTCERGAETKDSKAKRPKTGGIDLQTEVQNWATPRSVEATGGTYTRDGGEIGKERLSLTGQACLSGLPAPPTPTDGDTSSQRGPDSRPLWSTPRAAERQQENSRDAHIALSKQVASTKRRLNPAFVEWLMGWPPGWSLPAERNGCGCSETASFLSRRRTHLSALLRRFGDAETRRSGRHRDAETQRGGREADDDER